MPEMTCEILVEACIEIQQLIDENIHPAFVGFHESR